MMVWPATLPQHSLKRGFNRALGDARMKARTDAGGGVMRRRLSVIPQPFSVAMNMTAEQVDILEAFVEALGGGVKPFYMPAQDGKKVSSQWVVQIGDKMPTFEPVGKDLWMVTIGMVRLPQ